MSSKNIFFETRKLKFSNLSFSPDWAISDIEKIFKIHIIKFKNEFKRKFEILLKYFYVNLLGIFEFCFRFSEIYLLWYRSLLTNKMKNANWKNWNFIFFVIIEKFWFFRVKFRKWRSGATPSSVRIEAHAPNQDNNLNFLPSWIKQSYNLKLYRKKWKWYITIYFK